MGKTKKNKTGRELFERYKLFIKIFVLYYKLYPNKTRQKLLAFHRYKNGKIGMLIRYAIIKSISKNVGENVSIHPNVFLFDVENIRFGNNISIHPMCYIDGSGGITIMDNVSIAHNVTIMSSSHTYALHDVPIKYQEMIYKETIIKDNVWIGSKSTILAGITINSGSIVGANSLVTKDVKENVVIGGVPAKIIKER